MKVYVVVELQLRSFLTSTPDTCECSNSRSDHFTPGKDAIRPHWMERWVSVRADLGTSEKKGISCLYLESSHISSLVPAPGQATRLTALFQIACHELNDVRNIIKQNYYYCYYYYDYY